MTPGRALFVGLLGVLVASGCVEYTEGTRVTVRLGPGAPLELEDGDSGLIAVDRTLLSVAAVELLPCEGEEAATSAALDALLDFLSPIGLAHAHDVAAATRSDTPTLVDLMASGDLATAIAELNPPPGRYCTIALTFGPADAAALAAPAEVAIDGHTLWVDGALDLPSGGTDLTIRATGHVAAVVPFVDSDGAPTVIDLGHHARTAEIRLELRHAEWLTTFPFGSLAPELWDSSLLQSLQQNISACCVEGE